MLEHGSRAVVYFSPDERRLITKGLPTSQSCRIWNISTGKLLLDLEAVGEKIDQVEISSNGKYFITESRKAKIRLWSLESLRPLTPRFGLVTRPIWTACSADGTWLAASDTTSTARLYNLQTRKPRELSLSFPVVRVAISSDGSRVLCHGKNSVAICDANNRKRSGDEASQRECAIRVLQHERRTSGLPGTGKCPSASVHAERGKWRSEGFARNCDRSPLENVVEYRKANACSLRSIAKPS